MSIGQRIRDIRQIRNLSVSELAEKAGVSPSAVSRWEHDSRSPAVEHLTKLEEALQVGHGYLSKVARK